MGAPKGNQYARKYTKRELLPSAMLSEERQKTLDDLPALTDITKLRVESFSPPSRDYVGIAKQYIVDVISGEIPACVYVINACKRQLRDWENFKNHPIFEWSQAHAEKVCKFVEMCPHVEGPKANEDLNIVLEPWQCFVLVTIFGWRRKDTGGRRFKRAYLEMGRGNGKSAISSAVALYTLLDDDEYGAQIFSAATTRDQAAIIWGAAKAMLEKSPILKHKFQAKVTQKSLEKPSKNCRFVALSSEAKTADGKNPHASFIDELHAHPTRLLYDVIKTGHAKRPSSLIWMITTAGSDFAGICYEVHQYVIKILDGTFEDDSHFGIIYTTDEGDDWKDPKSWQKANPNWGVSVYADEIANQAKEAANIPAQQSNFKTKILCQWVGAANAWMDIDLWRKCADPELKESQFIGKGEQLIVSLDLATVNDIVAKMRLFWRDVNGERHYYIFPVFYLPQSAIDEAKNSQYGGWAIQGFIKVNPGSVVKFSNVKADIVEDKAKYTIKEVAYDAWQGKQMAQELAEEQRLVMEEVMQTTKNFSSAMKEVDVLVRTGRLHHDGNPVMDWMISNVVCKMDKNENIFPLKEVPANKIDGAVALFMALSRAMVYKNTASVYTGTRGLRVL